LADELLATRAIAVAGHLVFLAVVLEMVWHAVPTRLLIGWAAAMLVLLTVGAIWSGVAPTQHLSPVVIARTVRAMVTALGLGWGLGTALFAQSAAPSILVLIVMGLTGLVAAGTTTLVADRWAFPLYLTAIFVPALVGLILGPERPQIEQVALIVLFAGFMLRVHARGHETLVQRLRAETMLRSRERQLADAQAIAHVGSWEWNITTNEVTWSDELRRIFGVPLDAPASYAAFVERIHPADRERVLGLVAASAAQGREMDYDWRMLRPDGEERHAHTRNIVITDATGRATRMLGTCLDITDRKRAEETQRTLLSELQASVAEVKVLKGILPICASCKRIKNETGGWEPVESFVRERTHAEFSHGLCPDCAARDWGAAPSTHQA
jgi:PAS domain S-box-containing protein